MSVLVALQPAGGAFTSTATWDQAPATWAATATESFASTATYVQAAATWQATASEAYPSSATWLQAAATWSAVANEAFAATGSFVQAAAAWNALAAVTSAGTNDFTATWLQDTATWAAGASVPPEFTASWTQTQTWDAQMQGPAPTGGMGGRFGAIVQRYSVPVPIPTTYLEAAFAQAPPGWAADMDINTDELVLGLREGELALV